MWLEDFKSGHWRKQYQYKSFSPAPVNVEWQWRDPRINTLLEQARGALGEFNAFGELVPDIDLFIQMHVVKEATASSRIGDTQTTPHGLLRRPDHRPRDQRPRPMGQVPARRHP